MRCGPTSRQPPLGMGPEAVAASGTRIRRSTMKTTFVALAGAAAILAATSALADTSGRDSTPRTSVGTLHDGRAPAVVVRTPDRTDRAYSSTIRGERPSLRENDPTLPYWAQEWDPSPRRF